MAINPQHRKSADSEGTTQSVLKESAHADPPRPGWVPVAAGMAALYFIWGSTYLAIRVAVETMPPLSMAGARFLLAGSVLWLVLVTCGRFRATARQWRDNSIIGAFMLLGGNGLVVWAEKEVPSGITTLVISLNPIFVVLGEWLIALWLVRDGKRPGAGEDQATRVHPSVATWAGLILGFLGLALLVAPSATDSANLRLDLTRIGALVLACISWTIGTFATRHLRQRADPFSGAAIQMLAGGMWLGLAGWVFGEPFVWQWQEISGRSWIAWSYLLVAGSLVAFTTYIWLTRHCSPTLVSTYAYVNPVVAVFLGWLILDEAVGPRLFTAATVIVVAVALITTSRRSS